MANGVTEFLEGLQAGFTGVPTHQRKAERRQLEQKTQLGDMQLETERVKQQKLMSAIRKEMRETNQERIKENAMQLNGAWNMVKQNPAEAYGTLSSYRGRLQSVGADTTWIDDLLTGMRDNPAAAVKELEAGAQAVTAAGLVDRGNTTFGSSENYMDEDGNYYSGTQQRSSMGNLGYSLTPVGGAPDQPVGRLTRLNAQGMTPTQAAEHQAEKARQEGLVKASLDMAKTAFDQIGPAKQAISQYDELIRLIDTGAETGPIASMLPSFQAESIKLENLKNRMGLQVVAGAGFGALSESELEMALSTALPDKLEGPELRKWAMDKKAAQEKLLFELTRAANFFYSGGTPADWLKQNSRTSPAAGGSGSGGGAPAPKKRVVQVDF